MKLSIIVPIYNAEKSLDNCINSILKQTFSDYELILIDDGSTDASASICDFYANKYSFVYAYHIENSGPSAARNFGLMKSKGEYIQFVDSDDNVTETFGTCFYEISEEQKPDLIIGNAHIVDENNNIIKELKLRKKGTFSVVDLLSEMTNADKEQYLHYIWNKWYKTEIIKKYNISFDDTVQLGEDFLFNCAFFTNAVKVILPDVEMYLYRKHSGQSLTGRFNCHEIDRRRKMDNTFLAFLNFYNVYKANKNHYDAEIGKITMQSMEAINLESCQLNYRQKCEYINQFLSSEYYDYLMKIKNEGTLNTFSNLILLLAKRKLCNLIVILFSIKKILKK